MQNILPLLDSFLLTFSLNFPQRSVNLQESFLLVLRVILLLERLKKKVFDMGSFRMYAEFSEKLTFLTP